MTDELLLANEKLFKLNTQLIAENRKLREALIKINTVSQPRDEIYCDHVETAREALEVKK